MREEQKGVNGEMASLGLALEEKHICVLDVVDGIDKHVKARRQIESDKW